MKFNNKVKNLAFALFIGCASITYADNLPKVEILGKKYYMYEAKKGESLFGIAHANNWDLNLLSSLNPKAISPIKKGTKLYYPVASNSTAEKKHDSETKVSAEKPLNHKVKLGETVYGIAKMYSVSEEQIYKLNPASKQGIREGETLRISNSPVVKGSTGSSSERYYTVKKGDTLFKVAKEQQTSVASILKENPGVSENNFQAGSVIRLPEKGTGVKQVTKKVSEEKLSSFDTYTVDKTDTWESIAEKTGVSKKDILQANKEAGERPKRKSIISIPKIDTIVTEKVEFVSDPRENTLGGVTDIYEDVHNITVVDTLKEMRIALLLAEPASRKDIEFSRGVLTAVDALKHSGIHIELSLIDGTQNSTDVLSELSSISPNLIVLTNDKGIPSWLTEYAEVSQTPTVNTFDIKNELYTENPYVIQLLTPSNYFNDKIAKKLNSDYPDYSLIFVGAADNSDQFAASLKDIWGKKGVLSLTIDEFKKFELNDNSNYLIYGFPVKKDEIVELLDAVSEQKTLHPLSGMKVFGRPNWILYDESLSGKFYDSETLIPSRFYYDKESSRTKSFEDRYRALFKNDPYKSYPVYAALGYDSANYFIKDLTRANMDANALGLSETGVQSEFEIQRPTNWSGMVNQIVYILRYTPFSTIEKQQIR